MMDLAQQRIFSILFAAGEPLEATRVAQAAGMDEAAVEKYLPALRESLEEAGVPLPVSYTHLDVYKRQTQFPRWSMNPHPFCVRTAATPSEKVRASRYWGGIAQAPL